MRFLNDLIEKIDGKYYDSSILREYFKGLRTFILLHVLYYSVEKWHAAQ